MMKFIMLPNPDLKIISVPRVEWKALVSTSGLLNKGLRTYNWNLLSAVIMISIIQSAHTLAYVPADQPLWHVVNVNYDLVWLLFFK